MGVRCFTVPSAAVSSPSSPNLRRPNAKNWLPCWNGLFSRVIVVQCEQRFTDGRVALYLPLDRSYPYNIHTDTDPSVKAFIKHQLKFCVHKIGDNEIYHCQRHNRNVLSTSGTSGSRSRISQTILKRRPTCIWEPLMLTTSASWAPRCVRFGMRKKSFVFSCQYYYLICNNSYALSWI